MKINTLILPLLFLMQGCTALGIVADSMLDNNDNKYQNERNVESATLHGLKTDIKIVKSLINDEPLSLSDKKAKKPAGCSNLKGKEQQKCYDVSKQLKESI